MEYKEKYFPSCEAKIVEHVNGSKQFYFRAVVRILRDGTYYDISHVENEYVEDGLENESELFEVRKNVFLRKCYLTSQLYQVNDLITPSERQDLNLFGEKQVTVNGLKLNNY